MLNSILAVTICAEDLAAVAQAYTTYLDYRIVERGVISSALAAAWDALRTAGREFLLLQPVSGEAVYLRFVQAAPVAGYAPFKTFGWNATELLVQDPDALAERLAASPFQIIGPPRNLSSNEHVRAMQVLGPANEVLYLTRIAPGASGYNLGSAQTAVDRVFIVVLGGGDLNALREFYAGHFQLRVTPPVKLRISTLSNAYGLDPELLHEIAIVRLPERFLLELDQYPPQAISRPRATSELPPGVAMVSFLAEADCFDGLTTVRMEAKPYDGRRVAVIKGAVDELIELVG
jgi:hypothetical protein